MKGMLIRRSVGIGALLMAACLAGSGAVVAQQLHAGKQRIYHHTATTTAPVYTFGQRGGNIRPFEVKIDGNGAVTSNLGKSRSPKLALAQDTLNGLARLADAEHFSSLPPSIRCTGTLPDIASRYITITTQPGDTTVQVHGGCNTAFNELFGTLFNTAGVTF